jgi:hypothetical protein
VEEEVEMDEHERRPWAEVVMLGDTRFGMLEGGPFDGRCYPLLEGTPAVLDVPGPKGGSARTIRYVLAEGRYRYAGDIDAARSAA